MAKGHRSQIKRLRNENKDTRPKATVSYARVSVTSSPRTTSPWRPLSMATPWPIWV